MSTLNCSSEDKEEGRRGISCVWQGFGPPIHKNVFSRIKVSNLALGQNHGLLLTVDNKVFTFGTGPGLGSCLGIKNYCLPTPVGDLYDKTVIQVACGSGDQSAAVCDDGSLYMWGNNSEGQCGQPLDLNSILTPTLIKIKDHTHTCKLRDSIVWFRVKICQVSCGKSHTLALCHTGELWTWGTIQGILSTPHKVESPLLTGRKILSICCGLSHSIAVVCSKENEESKCSSPQQQSAESIANEVSSLHLSSGCTICDTILLGSAFSRDDLIEERNCCPFGLSLVADSIEQQPTPTTRTHNKKCLKNKRLKDLVNAAVGAGREIILDSESDTVDDELENSPNETIEANDESHMRETNAAAGEKSVLEVSNVNDENSDIDSSCEINSNDVTLRVPYVSRVSEEKPESSTASSHSPLRPNRLSITDSFRQGFGYLSVQSVQNFLSTRFSSSANDVESLAMAFPAASSTPEPTNSVLDGRNSSRESAVSHSLVDESRHSALSPLDQFSFVYSDNWQSMEMETYNTESADVSQTAIRGTSSSLMSLNIETKRHSDIAEKSTKVSSCEQVNIIRDSSGLSFEVPRETKSDSDSSFSSKSWLKCDVLSWGSGSEGQLGHGDSLSSRDQPIRLRSLVDCEVVKVVSGHFHCLLLTACGQVYGWGLNSHGQLALPSSEHHVISPQLIKIPDNAFVWDIGAGAKSSIFLVNRFGEQQLYICGKREGQLDESNSIKTESLTLYSGHFENLKISQTYGGGSYFGCVMDQVAGGHLGVLYELTNTELSFFSFLNKLANTALIPILQNESLVSACGATVQLLFESFLEISRNSARNGHRLRYIIQKADRKESRPLFHDLEQQLNLYKKFCKHYCDALAINGFGVAVKVANSIFKQASKIFMEMSNSSDVKVAVAPETLQHLMEEPIRRMNQYKKLFFNLAQQRKQKNWSNHWELQAAEKWDTAISWVANEKLEAERTRAFWDVYPNKVSEALKKPGRRLLRDSKVHPVGLRNSGRFATHWFILFNDILAHYQFTGLEKYDLSVIWIDPAIELDGKGINAFTLTLPEETLVLVCDTSAAKTEWVSALNSAIDRKLKMKSNLFDDIQKPGSSRLSLVRCNPPLVRHASYSFIKSTLYKDASYTGMWICGQLQGHGELTWGDGRQYVGQFKQNNQDGFGTYIVESSNGQTIYRGSWKNGKLNGLGSVKYPNGDTYEGYFKDRLRHGHGVLKCGRFVMSSASIYIGHWVNDKKDGYGVMDNIEKGEKYIGFWQDDVPHGKGMLVTLDGIYFEGSFTKGQMGGTGLVFDDGSWYEGEVGPDQTFNGKGTLLLDSGDCIEGTFTGAWNDSLKLTGTLTRASKRKTSPELTFPKSFGCWSVRADDKWVDIFQHCYEMLGITEETPGDITKKAWESAAVVLTNWKKTHWKPSKSKSLHTCEDMSILERIPIDDLSDLNNEKYTRIKDYLLKAFDTPYHPLGRLMDGLVDVFRATYVGTGAHPCLLQHSVEEVRSYVQRINDVVRILFPCLPATGEQFSLKVGEQSLVEDDVYTDAEIDIVTSEGLLLPILLPKIHPPLFTLYALRHEKDDNIYWDTLMKWNKQSDIALMAFLGIDEKFWTCFEDVGYLRDKRAVSLIGNVRENLIDWMFLML
ncbi:agglutinin-like protein 2, variant 2 [Chamberlinius hualienensis]